MLEIRDLNVRYGSFQAVAGLSLSAAAGEVLALLGPNGAGNISTVRCLVGLQRPTSGQVVVAGHDAVTESGEAKRAIGYVPEVARMHDPLTPRESLTLKGRLFEMDESTIRTGIARLLDGLGLSERIDTPLSGFSKGMTQKVCLAGALLTEPKVLVLDEPLSGLDVETTLLVKAVLREFADAGGTVLYCSHLLDVVETVADRVAVMAHGQLLAAGTLDELRSKAAVGGSDTSADASLESVFRDLTRTGDPAARARELLGR